MSIKNLSSLRDSLSRTHHAQALIGDREEIKRELFAFLDKDLKFPVKGNPDFWWGEFNVFKIDDSRNLNDLHLNNPVKYDKKIFAIFTNSITQDAQNSLLKIFEEPKANTIFFLILPSLNNLIPTLRSRLMVSDYSDFITSDEAEKFLKAKVGKRLDIVTQIVRDLKDEKITKGEVVSFLKGVAVVMKENRNLSALENIERAISYANDESPSIRIILEHLAVTL